MRLARKFAVFGISCVFFAWQPAALPSDLEREKNWSEQNQEMLIAGDPVWLEADQHKFLALYNQPEKPRNPKQAVVLLHGRGVHPRWGFLENLWLDLADQGFYTLSLQLPVLGQDALLAQYAETFTEAFRRIDAAITYLKQQGIDNVVLLGHSSGAITMTAYLAERPRSSFRGAIAIGLSAEPQGGRRMQPVFALEQLRLPILDVYGSQDLPVVLDFNAARATAAHKAGNRLYRQKEVKDANHFFTGQYAPLKATIIKWLDALPPPE